MSKGLDPDPTWVQTVFKGYKQMTKQMTIVTASKGAESNGIPLLLCGEFP